jgi:hypothetical protein
VDFSKRKTVPNEATPETERRRIGTVVHDDRGNASVSWRDAPADYERPGLSVKHEESYDPYARRETRKGGAGKRTDLRKLSEWIKQMRELEARKRGDSEK